MNRLTYAALVLALVVSGIDSRLKAAEGDGLKFEGNWKLVVLGFNEDEFMILKAGKKDAGPTAEVVAAQDFLGEPAVKQVTAKGDALRVVILMGEVESSFQGTLAKSGKQAGRVLGTFQFRTTTYPARLEATEAKKPAEMGRGPIAVDLMALRQEVDVKIRVEKMQGLLEKHAGTPTLYLVYSAMLQSAEAAEMPAKDVQALWEKWSTDAKPYGDAWVNDIRTKALAALNGKKDYAALSLSLAKEANKAIGEDASTEQKAAVSRLLASAARLAGDLDLAKTAEARSLELETKLDDEYHAKVPPFKPEAFAGRKNPKDNSVVMLELFTGAQCPPCVAADVGFDGLLKTYKPTEVILLQYHLHIPGPDPLTNPATIERARYYEANSTPSSYFNGMEDAQGGGGMANSRAKYDQFREVIEGRLEGQRRANIELKVTRDGTKLQITALASTATAVDKNAPDKKPDAKDAKAKDEKQDKPDDKPARSKVVMRIAITEEAVRYVGGNGLRFHHHIVRAFPGGAAGRPLEAGKCEVKATVDLDELRKELGAYVETFGKKNPFAGQVSPAELKHLSVVAFVQDDDDKAIWHAVSMQVP